MKIIRNVLFFFALVCLLYPLAHISGYLFNTPVLPINTFYLGVILLVLAVMFFDEKWIKRSAEKK
ncbi:MAG: hypothetical protein WCH59_00925 [Chitinophagia bacterium]|jgi:hypothetical protein